MSLLLLSLYSKREEGKGETIPRHTQLIRLIFPLFGLGLSLTLLRHEQDTRSKDLSTTKGSS